MLSALKLMNQSNIESMFEISSQTVGIKASELSALSEENDCSDELIVSEASFRFEPNSNTRSLQMYFIKAPELFLFHVT